MEIELIDPKEDFLNFMGVNDMVRTPKHIISELRKLRDYVQNMTTDELLQLYNLMLLQIIERKYERVNEQLFLYYEHKELEKKAASIQVPPQWKDVRDQWYKEFIEEHCPYWNFNIPDYEYEVEFHREQYTDLENLREQLLANYDRDIRLERRYHYTYYDRYKKQIEINNLAKEVHYAV